jgi:hypothetical protein
MEQSLEDEVERKFEKRDRKQEAAKEKASRILPFQYRISSVWYRHTWSSKMPFGAKHTCAMFRSLLL